MRSVNVEVYTRNHSVVFSDVQAPNSGGMALSQIEAGNDVHAIGRDDSLITETYIPFNSIMVATVSYTNSASYGSDDLCAGELTTCKGLVWKYYHGGEYDTAPGAELMIPPSDTLEIYCMEDVSGSPDYLQTVSTTDSNLITVEDGIYGGDPMVAIQGLGETGTAEVTVTVPSHNCQATFTINLRDM